MRLISFTIFIIITFSTFTVNAVNARSIEKCDSKSASNVEYSQCLDTVKSFVDRELNAWVNNKVFELENLASVTGRTGTLSMFKKAQRNFETFRENNCKFYYLELSPGTGAASAYKKCYISLSKARIKELELLSSSL